VKNKTRDVAFFACGVARIAYDQHIETHTQRASVMAVFKLFSQHTQSVLITLDAIDVLDALDKINALSSVSSKIALAGIAASSFALVVAACAIALALPKRHAT